MLSRKTLLVVIILSFFISNAGMAVMCARLKSVSAGEDHSMALMDDNTLWTCGGSNTNNKQLGLGGGVYGVSSLKQVLGENGVGFLQNVATYDAGYKHSLAADANGTIWSWGTDDYGQLGNGAGWDNNDVPVKVHGIDDVGYLSDTVDIVYVSAGRTGTHSLAVDSNGYVYAWGNNYSGQCGIGESSAPLETPFLVLDDDPQTTGVYLGDIAFIIQADAAVFHSIALDNAGHVWHWGNGSDNQTYPEMVTEPNETELSDINQISCCKYHSVAVDSNGFVWEWGDSDTAYKVPCGEMDTNSTYLEGIVEVGAGYGYSMARTNDGRVLVWISSQYYASPEYVEDGEMETLSGLLEGIVSISAGLNDHKLAVCENGYGWAWGTSGNYGKFGVGDDDPHPEPTQMSCPEISPSIYFTKTSEIQGLDPNCARPFLEMGINNYLVYEICYGNPVTNPSDPNYHGSVYDVNIIDHLPLEADFYYATGGDWVYDPNARTVTWTIGELAPGDSNCFTLTTKVNDWARPGGEISNFIEMTSDMYYYYTTDTVPVCNYGTEIIYVDDDANGFNNGTSWDDAYNLLQDAFIGANNLGADIIDIWVAAGTYKPVQDVNEDSYWLKSFELFEDVALFGHFAGTETSAVQRNFADANNETILEGQIGDIVSEAVKYIVTADGIENAIVDGFTIRGSDDGAGIYLNDANVAVLNCKLKDNDKYGIDCYNYSCPDIHNCVFLDNSKGVISDYYCQPEVSASIFDGNGTTGILHSCYSVVVVDDCLFKDHTTYGIDGTNSTLTVTDSTFKSSLRGLDLDGVATTMTNCSVKNSNNGIWALSSDLTIDHSVIADNSYCGLYYVAANCNLTLRNSVVRHNGYKGIELRSSLTTTLVNNWIHNNSNAGIYFNNHTSLPLVRNNTIYDNDTYGIQISGQGPDPNILNCIIYDNDSNNLYWENEDFNTVNYCLLQNSHDGTGNRTGDPGFKNPTDPNDLHIAETSQCKDAGDPNGNYGDETDIDGESRVVDGQVDIGADEYYWSPADYDVNGIVSFIDYALFAAAWQTENAGISLDDDNDVDYTDLALFCEDWLWEVAFEDNQWMMCMGGSMGFGLEGGFAVESTGIEGIYPIEKPKAAPTDSSDDLMLSTAAESLKARPERLVAKSQKFYDITPETTISARQKALDARRIHISIKEILEMFDKIWLDGDLKEYITEEQYLEFRKAIEDLLQLEAY